MKLLRVNVLPAYLDLVFPFFLVNKLPVKSVIIDKMTKDLDLRVYHDGACGLDIECHEK